MVGKLRRFLRQSLRPLIMVGIAASVAMSLVVTTPSNAQAFVGPVIPPPIIAGAAEMVLPELIPAASILGPVGWGIAGVTVVGVGLYATRDYWLPYVTGAFGGGKDSDPSKVGGTTTSGYGVVNVNYHIGPMSPLSDGRSIIVNLHYDCSGSSCGVSLHLATRYLCKNTSTGVVSELKPVLTVSATITSTNNLSPVTLACNTGTTLQGAEVGLAGDGALPLRTSQPTGGPVEHLYWGNLKPGTFDPRGADVKYTTNVECIRPDGTKFTISKSSTGADGGLAVPSCEAASPGSHATGKMDVVGTPPATSGQPATTLLTRTAPAPSTDKPLCGPTIPGQGCKLQVLIDSAPCMMGSWDCIHWLDLSKDPNQSARISCQYGPYVVPLSTCNPLERAYEEGGAPATDANTDGDPSTRSDSDPNGQQVPNSSTSTGTGTGTVPGVAGAPAAGDTAGQDCFPNGWGMLNPAEWVLKPVGCALQSAFVPKTETVQEQTTRIQNKINTVGFASVTTAWQNTFDQVGGGSGCAGPTVNFNFGGVNQSLEPFNACSQPMATVAGITYAFSCIVIVLAGGLGIGRAIASGFGFNFTLGRGSSD